MSETKHQKSKSEDNRDSLTLGGGCFWCLEAIFNDLRGVMRVESGYSGGNRAMPSYEQVCSGETGHAEVVQVTFDPDVISASELLEVFFAVHDPTTLNRQGADVGTQYRSVIFYRDEAQKAEAERAIAAQATAGIWTAPIVTEIAPFASFYKAEDYHENYFRLNGAQPYCRLVIAPKLAKFHEHYREKLKR
jgi:peptide-methionine (S)-S-oxide reductase